MTPAAHSVSAINLINALKNEFRTNVHRLPRAGRERVCTGMECDDFYDDASAQEALNEGACLRVRRVDALVVMPRALPC